jgi:hypothetical protein
MLRLLPWFETREDALLTMRSRARPEGSEASPRISDLTEVWTSSEEPAFAGVSKDEAAEIAPDPDLKTGPKKPDFGLHGGF